MVALLWIYCIAISIPPLFGFGEIRFTHSISTCSLYFIDSSGVTDNIFYEVFSILEALLLPIPLLMVTNIGMIIIVYRHLKSRSGRSNGNNREAKEKHKSKIHFQLVKVYGAIFLSNLIT